MNLPAHVTLEWLLNRCNECPCCGNMTNWPTTEAGKARSPTIDLVMNGKRSKLYVRRIVWKLTHPNGRLPEGRTSVITSRCSNRHCIDPDQIYQTAKSAAFQQASQRGSWRGPELRLKNAINGAKRSRLSDEAVEDIVTSGDRAVDAARKHGVSEAYIHMLRGAKFRRTVTARHNPFSMLMS